MKLLLGNMKYFYYICKNKIKDNEKQTTPTERTSTS